MIAEAEESIKILGKVCPSIFNEEFAVLIRRIIRNKRNITQDKTVIGLEESSEHIEDYSPFININLTEKQRLIAQGFCDKGNGLDILKSYLPH